MTIGNELRKQRKALGLTLKEIAGNGMSISRLSNIENGKTPLDPKTWHYLQQTLNLRQNLYVNEQKRTKLKHLLKEASTYEQAGLSDQAIKLYQDIIDQAEEALLFDIQAQSCFQLGNLLINYRDLQQAENQLTQALDIFKHNDTAACAPVIMKLGVIQFHRNHYDKAIQMFHNSLNTVPEERSHLKGSIYYNLASAHFRLKAYDKTAYFSEKALIHLPDEASEQIIGTYILQGIMYAENRFYQSSLQTFYAAKQRAETMNHQHLLGKIHHNIAMCESAQLNDNGAEQHLAIALAIKQAKQDTLGELRTLLAMANTAIKQRDYSGAQDKLNEVTARLPNRHESEWIETSMLQKDIDLYHGRDILALDHLHKALTLANRMQATHIQTDIYDALARYYHDHEQWDAYYRTLHDKFQIKKEAEEENDNINDQHAISCH
ncbi:helix-turn-helix domain-containing protein [Tuberibacillus sp. Marseille-P3662]|uniref:helix-turn-helix domain-containing protein n=1 Tax=Tuberibacillus sp. Marseille-P3662 TaxID=1965358 RepID=UPI000A1CBA3B|nr:helix-turn-helix domain-containing protein [Tuberibacillus sp. Marseille-P3662]